MFSGHRISYYGSYGWHWHPDIYLLLCNLRRRGWKISYLGPESVGVPLQYDRHGFLPDRFIIDVVAATIAIAISAIIATCEAFAIKFQAL
jgi:hypothetical protein